jgi:hypothetical protein
MDTPEASQDRPAPTGGDHRRLWPFLISVGPFTVLTVFTLWFVFFGSGVFDRLQAVDENMTGGGLQLHTIAETPEGFAAQLLKRQADPSLPWTQNAERAVKDLIERSGWPSHRMTGVTQEGLLGKSADEWSETELAAVRQLLDVFALRYPKQGL